MYLSFLQVFAFLAATAHAVDVASYPTTNCRSLASGVCLDWPANHCCEFVKHHTRLYNELRATQSVGWRNLQRCDIASWHWASNNLHSHNNPTGQCGTVRDAVNGPAITTCMSSVSRLSSTGDGAMWINTIDTLHGQCPRAGSVKAMTGFNNRFGKNLFGAFTKGGKARRDSNQTDPLAALDRLYQSDPNFKCRGKVYADTLGWTNGTGVWVLEGSQQAHELYTNATGTHPHLDHNGWMEKAGARYFEHWNQHPVSHAIQTNHGENNQTSILNDKRSFAGQKWVTGKGLVDDDSVVKRSPESDTESFPWISESEDDANDDDDNGKNVVHKRAPNEDAQESFPWIPESEEDDDDNEAGGTSKRDIVEEEQEEPYESFPWIR